VLHSTSSSEFLFRIIVSPFCPFVQHYYGLRPALAILGIGD
jgi:hypothetical protein